MSEVKSNLSSRLLAAFLSVIMVFSIIPFTAFTAFAATTEHPDAVTISIVDEDGAAVQGATVQFAIDSVANGEDYITKTETTDANGCVEIMSSADFVADDLTVSATVTKTDYTEGSITNESITSDTQNFAIVITSTVIKDVTITANSGLVYDGQPQSLVTITGKQPTDTISYRVDDVDAENAEKTDAGTYEVIRLVHTSLYGTVTIIMLLAILINITVLETFLLPIILLLNIMTAEELLWGFVIPK